MCCHAVKETLFSESTRELVPGHATGSARGQGGRAVRRLLCFYSAPSHNYIHGRGVRPYYWGVETISVLSLLFGYILNISHTAIFTSPFPHFALII